MVDMKDINAKSLLCTLRMTLRRNTLLAVVPFGEKNSLDKSLGDFANRTAKALNPQACPI